MPGAYNAGQSPNRVVLVNGTTLNDIVPQEASTATSPNFSRTSGAVTMATPTPVTVAATATLLVAARTGRGSVKIINEGTTEVFIGPANTVTISSGGDILLGTRGASHTYNYAGALYGIVGTGTQLVRVVELY